MKSFTVARYRSELTNVANTEIDGRPCVGIFRYGRTRLRARVRARDVHAFLAPNYDVTARFLKYRILKIKGREKWARGTFPRI